MGFVELLLIEGIEVAGGGGGHFDDESGRAVNLLLLDPVHAAGRDVQHIGLHHRVVGEAHVHRGKEHLSALPLHTVSQQTTQPTNKTLVLR